VWRLARSGVGLVGVEVLAGFMVAVVVDFMVV
jgi:hypothetical protein